MSHFLLVTETELVTEAELYSMSKAAEICAGHCASVWKMDAPAVDVVSKRSKIPDSCHPIVFLDRETDIGTLASHYWDPIRKGPAARVFCQRATGVNSGLGSMSEALCHEILEAMVDPKVDLWRPHPQMTDGTEMALEICDMVQDHYRVQVDGEDWRVANFVTPDYFRVDLTAYGPRRAFLDTGGRFDYCGRLDIPGEIKPEGYAILRRPKPNGGWERLAASAAGARVLLNDNKRHAWARTTRRLDGPSQSS